jgi:hypothetical protein
MSLLPPSRPDRLLVATGLVLLAAHLTAAELFRKPGGRVIVGDATHHYVQLRSIVFDRDLDFENDYTGLARSANTEPAPGWLDRTRTASGLVRNYMPVGPALLWMPLFVVAASFGWIGATVGFSAPPDGFDRYLQQVPGITGVLAVMLAAILTRRLIAPRDGHQAALLATWSIWVGTHALYYSLVSPAYSHAASMLTSTIFVAHWLRHRGGWSVGSLAASGALAGLAALMRWQDAVFFIVPFVEALRWSRPATARLTGIGCALIAFLVVFSPQMVVWTVLYGQPFALPQGPSFMRWLAPHPFAVLFSDYHGLFAWAPLLVPAVIGLVAVLWRDRRAALPIGLVLVASWYTNAAVADWWAGEAYGARRFLSLFPLFAIGLSAWMTRSSPTSWRVSWRHGTVVALVAANLLLLLQYQLFLKGHIAIAPYPAGWVDMFLTRFVVPLRLLSQWIQSIS